MFICLVSLRVKKRKKNDHFRCRQVRGGETDVDQQQRTTVHTINDHTLMKYRGAMQTASEYDVNALQHTRWGGGLQGQMRLCRNQTEPTEPLTDTASASMASCGTSLPTTFLFFNGQLHSILVFRTSFF